VLEGGGVSFGDQFADTGMILKSSEPKLRDWSSGVRVIRKLGIFIVILSGDFFARSDLSSSRLSLAADKIGTSIEQRLLLIKIFFLKLE